jgi:hypothetical protein
MSDFTRFKNFSIGILALTATVIMIGGAYGIYTQWQPIWSEGFSDFKGISTAIVGLEKTAKPIADIAPDVLTEMKQMNISVALMQGQMEQMKDTMFLMHQSIKHIDISVHGLNLSVWGMSRTVPQQMNKMQNKISPMGFFSPFNQ